MMMRTDCFVALMAAGLLTEMAHAGQVQVIDDRSFFNNIPHTLIDFETRGDGTPFPLKPGGTIGVVPNDFASLGVEISGSPGFPGARIVKTFEEGIGRAALEAMGSYPNYLVDFNRDGFIRFELDPPARSLALAANRTVSDDSGILMLEAFNLAGESIAQIMFGQNVIDGILEGSSYGSPNDLEFGFFGLSTSTASIATVILHEDLASFDDLHFSVVPEPPTLLGFGLVALFCASRRLRRVAALSSLVFTGVTITAQAGPVQVIDDRSFFDNIPHTLIDFETRGDGTPLVLEPNRFIVVHPDEFVQQSLRIAANDTPPQSPSISNVGLEQSLVALKHAGSAPNALFIAASGIYVFEFLSPVNAFGFAVLNAPTFDPVVLTVFDALDEPIASLTFDGAFVDGTVYGGDYGTSFDWNYGFLGLAVPGRMISYATVSEEGTAIDDLHFGLIPEPATWLGFGLIAAYCARRRPLLHRPA